MSTADQVDAAVPSPKREKTPKTDKGSSQPDVKNRIWNRMAADFGDLRPGLGLASPKEARFPQR